VYAAIHIGMIANSCVNYANFGMRVRYSETGGFSTPDHHLLESNQTVNFFKFLALFPLYWFCFQIKFFVEWPRVSFDWNSLVCFDSHAYENKYFEATRKLAPKENKSLHRIRFMFGVTENAHLNCLKPELKQEVAILFIKNIYNIF